MQAVVMDERISDNDRQIGHSSLIAICRMSITRAFFSAVRSTPPNRYAAAGTTKPNPLATPFPYSGSALVKWPICRS